VPVLGLSGDTVLNPWTGGLNACQFSRFDADRDGNEDLFVFDRIGDKLELFLYREEGGNPVWKHSESYDDAFPELSDWVLCRDFDQDGDRDLFTSNSAGIALYENTTTGNGPLEFELVSDQLLSDHYPADTSTGPINIYVQSADIPAIDDIDGDGDLDILSFSLLGNYLEYQKNMALEIEGHTDTVIYERMNACWGFFSEGVNGNIALNDSCSSNVQNPEGLRHSGSTLLTLNMNGDSAKELVLGDLGSNRLVKLRNGGGPSSSFMDQVTNPFPSGDPVELETFPAAFYLDVDHDGTRDLIVTPNDRIGSNDQQSIWYYENHGNDSVPSFELQQRDLLQDGTIDLGRGAYPEFMDIDGDGDQDLFVGNRSLKDQSGQQASSIAYFENIGTPTDPAFRLRNKDYQNFSQVGMGDALHPAFGDLDGDGDMDLMIGDSDGYIHYFENGSPVGDPPSYSLTQPQYPDDSGNTIDVGQYAAPTLVDLDGDGLLDLVLGEKGGNLVHYENVGTSSSASFAHRTDSLGKVSVIEPGGFEGYSVPHFFKDSGEYELVVGSKSGKLHYYKGIDGNLGGPFQLVTDYFGGIDDGKRSAPAIADLDADPRMDMILGDYGGGLHFYRGGEEINSLGGHREDPDKLHIWPNPVAAGQTLHVFRKEGRLHPQQLRVYDLQGRRVPIADPTREGRGRIRLRVPKVDPGLYFIRSSRSGEAHAFIVR
jgi:hypothetical protein